MGGSVRVTKNEFPKMKRRVKQDVDDALEAVARDAEGYVKRIMQESPATGQNYGDHIASSPGNPPRIDTGALINSINAQKVNRSTWKISTGMEYAPILEFGGEGVEARPFMTPMSEHVKKMMPGIITEILGDE